MEIISHFSCFPSNRSRKQSQSLQNIVKRRYANQNLYTTLKSYNDPPSRLRQDQQENEVLSHVRYYRAKCSFIGYDHTELTFNIGDIIEVEEAYSNRYLYRARNIQSGLIGNVSLVNLDNAPIVELQPWYFHNINRQTARNLLLNTSEVGTFLVRKSSSSGQVYSLSVRYEEDGRPRIMHYKIYLSVNGYYISEGCHERHLDSLIQRYLDDDGSLLLKPQLRKPCKRDNIYKISSLELRLN